MAQILTYVVNNGLATINGEFLAIGSDIPFFSKLTPLGKVQLKGTNNLIDLFEISSTFGGEVIIFDETFLDEFGEALVPVTSYTIANDRVYGGEQILLLSFGVLGITIPGITLDDEPLVKVRDFGGKTIAIITLTDWNNLNGGGPRPGPCVEQSYSLRNSTISPQEVTITDCRGGAGAITLDPAEERSVCSAEQPIPDNPMAVAVLGPLGACLS